MHPLGFPSSKHQQLDLKGNKTAWCVQPLPPGSAKIFKFGVGNIKNQQAWQHSVPPWDLPSPEETVTTSVITPPGA